MDSQRMNSLLRLVLLWASVISYRVAASTPNVSKDKGAQPARIESKDEPGKESKYREEMSSNDIIHDTSNDALDWVTSCREFALTFVWLLASIETIAIFLSISYPSSKVLDYVCPTSERILVTPPGWSTVALTTIALAGGYLRRSCYTALGRMFTFAHTTRADHILVTWGPYAYARHIGYTSAAMALWGAVAVAFSHGGWIRECGIWPGRDTLVAQSWDVLVVLWVFRVTTAAWALLAFTVVFLLMFRAPKEDATLKARFGKEWEAYRRRVPWMFIPYIF